MDLSGLEPFGPYSAVPDELIPAGNVHTVMASGYGYRTFGSLMCDRQTLSIRRDRAGDPGVLTPRCCRPALRRLRRALAVIRGGDSWSGAFDMPHVGAGSAHMETRRALTRTGSRSADLFSSEASLIFQFDWIEDGTW